MIGSDGPQVHFSASRCDQGWAGVFGLRQRKAVGPRTSGAPVPALDTPPSSLHMHPRVHVASTSLDVHSLSGPGIPSPQSRLPESTRWQPLKAA